MTVHGYTRVSTDRQADEGESLDVQRRKLEGYAHLHGRTLAEKGVADAGPVR
jgi:putative DNA-invertase from lambdoid prophage Rac